MSSNTFMMASNLITILGISSRLHWLVRGVLGCTRLASSWSHLCVVCERDFYHRPRADYSLPYSPILPVPNNTLCECPHWHIFKHPSFDPALHRANANRQSRCSEAAHSVQAGPPGQPAWASLRADFTTLSDAVMACHRTPGQLPSQMTT
jgi:hypothetical protein